MNLSEPPGSSIEEQKLAKSSKWQLRLKAQEEQHRDWASTLPNYTRCFSPRASIILIGARASGKRSLGFIAASQLGRRFISESLYFEEHAGLSKRDFLLKYGADAFRNAQVDAFRHMLEQNTQDCVIECGVASLANKMQTILRKVSERQPVIHITRNIDHMCQLTGTKASDTEGLRRADKQHRKCSNLEFYNLYDPSSRSGTDETDFSPRSLFVLRDVKLDFHIFIRLTTGKLSMDRRHPASVSSVAIEERSYTHVAVIHLSDLLQDSGKYLESIHSGEDAVELKIDLFHPDILSTIGKYINKLRRNNRLPLIYTVEKSALASAADPEAAYFDLTDHGLRHGVEYIRLDLTRPRSLIKQVIRNKGYTKIIGTRHFDTKASGSWLESSRLDEYRAAKHSGVDIVQFTQLALSRQDNVDVQIFSYHVSQEEPGPELIAYNTGALGKTSLIFNRIMTPVKLPGFEASEDCSLITCKDATQALFKVFKVDSLEFQVLGDLCEEDPTSGVYKSVFNLHGLEHSLAKTSVENFGQLLQSIRSPLFGGAFVSPAHKVEASNMVQSQSKHAAIIGAVNTVLPLRHGADGEILPFEGQFMYRNRAGPVAALYGENTDWIGIMRCFQRRLSPRNAAGTVKGSALVVGAGGAARSAIYAMIQLGYRHVFIYGKSEEEAQKLAAHFNNTALRGLESGQSRSVRALPFSQIDWPDEVSTPTAIMCCDLSEDEVELNIPNSWLQSFSGGVVGDVSYRESGLVQRIKPRVIESKASWELFNGLEIFIEHGSIQFELLTGRRVPVRLLRKLVHQGIET